MLLIVKQTYFEVGFFMTAEDDTLFGLVVKHLTMLWGQSTAFPSITAPHARVHDRNFTANRKRTAHVRGRICVKDWGTKKDWQFSMFAGILFHNFIFVLLWLFKLCMRSCISLTQMFYSIIIKKTFFFSINQVFEFEIKKIKNKCVIC